MAVKEEDMVQVVANDLATRYNKLRHEFYNIVVRYYRQPVSTNYYNEEDLIKRLEELERIKNEYLKLRDVLISRKQHIHYEKGWHRNNDALF